MNNTPFTIEIISSFNDEYAFLSNFYPAVVCFEGAEYPTLEHAYQAAKTLNKKERELIRKCETAGQAKKMGRNVLMREHWDRIKNDVMRELIDQKFEIPKLNTIKER